MVPKKPREKRTRVEEDGVEGRAGVTRRGPNFVVEMRLSKKVGGWKLHLGTYKTLWEAMVARDYGAYLRDSTGKEDRASVGGFGKLDDHPSIFEFEESLEVFRGLEDSRAHPRREEFKGLLEDADAFLKAPSLRVNVLPTPDACQKFCKAAREDISVVIESFRSRDPQKFANPVDGETLSSEVRVSPTPGRAGASSGEWSTISLSVEAESYVSDILFATLRRLMPDLTDEKTSKITKEAVDRIQKSLFVEWLENPEPCLIDPAKIPNLE